MLIGNYPNPFYKTTVIRYSLAEEQEVVIVVYDLKGNTLATLVDEKQTAGIHNVLFNPDQLPEGIYFLKMKTNFFNKTAKMLVFKH